VSSLWPSRTEPDNGADVQSFSPYVRGLERRFRIGDSNDRTMAWFFWQAGSAVFRCICGGGKPAAAQGPSIWERSATGPTLASSAVRQRRSCLMDRSVLDVRIGMIESKPKLLRKRYPSPQAQSSVNDGLRLDGILAGLSPGRHRRSTKGEPIHGAADQRN
jgi:hypothetical protein